MDDSFDLQHEVNMLNSLGEISLAASCQLGPATCFSYSEAQDAIYSLEKNKAPGPDSVESEHLIYGGEQLTLHLRSPFNLILATGHVPAAFKTGYTIPIPKSPDKDITNPSNYRGISLLFIIAKVFEKSLAVKLEEIIQLNPLQGSFHPGLSCLHTAFILQEGILSVREKKVKALVTFLDAQKAFDTVWHTGLFFKLRNKGCPLDIWRVIQKWYSSSSCAILWKGLPSRFIPIQQGVRQGAVLFPLLYSIYVDALLDELLDSGLGVHIGKTYIGAPMFADDLALLAADSTTLQSMLDIVYRYPQRWRYKINPTNSAVLVFGESSPSRAKLRPTRNWYLGTSIVAESDQIRHLGIIQSVQSSTIGSTNERASAGRSAFFGLNMLGSRFGCLHPSTSYRLYSTFSIPIMLYGSEIWKITNSEVLLLERVHRKIVRTVQGFPTRCPVSALNGSVGSLDIDRRIIQRKLSFAYAITTLFEEYVVRSVLAERVSNGFSEASVISSQTTLLRDLALPSVPELLQDSPVSLCTWKKSLKEILLSRAYNQVLDSYPGLPIS